MSIANAIAIVAISGTRNSDGTVVICDKSYPGFPERITIEGITFDFTEEEEVDPEIKYWLGHYFKRDEVRRKPDQPV